MRVTRSVVVMAVLSASATAARAHAALTPQVAPMAHTGDEAIPVDHPLPEHRVMTVSGRRRIRDAAVLGLLGMLPLMTGCSDSGLKDGPLRVRGGDAVVTMESKVGQLVAYGFNVMTNEGASSITNISAELVPASEGAADAISFEAPVVVDIAGLDTGYLGAGPWPAQEWSKHAKPLQGFEMTARPDGQIELFVLARVTTAGEWLWPTTRIEYDYAGTHYAEEVTNGFAVCAPAPCTPRTSSDSGG